MMSMDKQKKKELATAYRTTARPMGVYQIRNTANGKVLVQAAMDLDGARNRHAFSQQMNSNIFAELRHDWAAFGSEAFVFEELDRIEPREDAPNGPEEQAAYKTEIGALLELWLEKLQPYDEAGYNKRKRATS